MRQLLLQVPRGRGDDVLAAAEGRDRSNAVILPARTTEEERDLDVSPRSPIEFLLFGLQSAGSWRTFLAYSVVSGAVAWVALYTRTIFLLTAAMLIAPFAAPALNTAIGSASGRFGLLRHSVARYVAAITAGAATAAILALVFGQSVPTELMIELSSLSVAHVLLPLLAGAAGALYLVQTDHSSLVSGAAVGMLVAASLAPPTGILGVAAAVGAWELALRAGYLIALQLAGINLVAAATFRYYGLDHEPARLSRVVGGLDDVDVDVRTARFAERHLLADVTVQTEPDLEDEVRRALPEHLSEQLGATGVPVDVDLTVHTAADVP